MKVLKSILKSIPSIFKLILKLIKFTVRNPGLTLDVLIYSALTLLTIYLLLFLIIISSVLLRSEINWPSPQLIEDLSNSPIWIAFIAGTISGIFVLTGKYMLDKLTKTLEDIDAKKGPYKHKLPRIIVPTTIALLILTAIILIQPLAIVRKLFELP